MPKPRKAWTFSPGKTPQSALPGTLKDEVNTKALRSDNDSGCLPGALE
ncbi:MAG TPA: hypothetical protein VK395_31090 [Gemmataceae bacterium]|nr:hypothetical protein [Gemmataceae bacterium]